MTTSVRKAFKYRIYPTREQQQRIDEMIDICCALYNTALEQRRSAYELRGILISCFSQERELKELREIWPELAAVHSRVLQDVLNRVDRAFRNFFRRARGGQKVGFPRYRSRSRYNSVTYKSFGCYQGSRIAGDRLVLSGIGSLIVRWSRPLEGTPKTVTVIRAADGYYVSFSCRDVPVSELPATGKTVGIDLGLEAFLTTSNGERILRPGWYRVAERRLKTSQRRLDRRKKGSRRREKALRLYRCAHQHIQRQRADFQHKVARRLVVEYDVICHENLQIDNMAKNHSLAKHIFDAGWGTFLRILSFKAECAGRIVVAVPPAYTSQICSGCGQIVRKSLRERRHFCLSCGLSVHRDHNAARNIERLGMSRRGGVAIAASENRERLSG